MPKMKTNKAVASRFKITGTGKLVRRHPGRRHKLEKKSPKTKHHLGSPALVDSTLAPMYLRKLGVA